MESLDDLRNKLESAVDIHSVVSTMKAVAASNIGQYEQAVIALEDYYLTISLGLAAYFKSKEIALDNTKEISKKKDGSNTGIIVFGSDQGLVGHFNDSLKDFVVKSLEQIKGEKEIWTVGERIETILKDSDLKITQVFNVPNSVNAITLLIADILINAQESIDNAELDDFFIIHNKHDQVINYIPVIQKLLPLDVEWSFKFSQLKWPTRKIPEIAGDKEATLKSLIREYLFVSLFKACAESLQSENTNRLAAMRRAEKNIEELLKDLNQDYHRLRQSSIDEELFDIVAGFEALKNLKGSK
jgi:F-type H+-transporting ATPase subunit gamma